MLVNATVRKTGIASALFGVAATAIAWLATALWSPYVNFDEVTAGDCGNIRSFFGFGRQLVVVSPCQQLDSSQGIADRAPWWYWSTGDSWAQSTRAIQKVELGIAEAHGWPFPSGYWIGYWNSAQDQAMVGQLALSSPEMRRLEVTIYYHGKLGWGNRTLKTWVPIPERAVGCRVIPAGLVCDTMFFGLVYFVVVTASRATIRTLRRRRCRCQSCGYDLAGILGSQCPECGHAATR